MLLLSLRGAEDSLGAGDFPQGMNESAAAKFSELAG